MPDVIERGAACTVDRVERVGNAFDEDRVLAVDRHSARGRVGRDRDVIADHVGIVFQIAAEIRDETSAAAEMRHCGARAGAEDTDVMGDVGIGADGVDHDRLDDVFAGVTVNVEGELVVGAAPLAQVNRMAGRNLEDVKIVGGGFPVRVLILWSSEWL